jgi:hypothetical protein
MTGFYIEQTIGGRILVGPTNDAIAIFGDRVDEQSARHIATALNDAAQQPARVARAVAYIEQYIAGMLCDDVPDELVCALCVLNPAAGCVEVLP